MKPSGLAYALSSALVLAGPTAFAQDRSTPAGETAREGSEDGAFASYSLPARVGSGVAKLRFGYDGARGRADGVAEAAMPIYGRLALRGGAEYDALDTAARPFVIGQLQLLDQEDDEAPVSLALLGGARARGFNGVSQAEVGVLVARRFGDALILGNVRYGQALDSAERSGSVSIASLLRAGHLLHCGVDSQLEADLERDRDEPVHEADFRVRAGPLLNFTYDVFAISAGGGVTALRYRLTPPTKVGGLAYLGVGAVF